MRILYPSNPLDPKQADEPFQEEYQAAQTRGLQCSLFEFDELQFGTFAPKPRLNQGERILYRGWMLNPKGYQALARHIRRRGALPITSPAHYVLCHHLPGWYEPCKNYTAETHFFPDQNNLEEKINALGWDAYFIKDYVKSNTTTRGSIAHSPKEALEVVKLIETYRGEIEGGVAVRRVEQYLPDTEKRYFVVKGKPHAESGAIPSIVQKISQLIDAPFFSIDTIERADGIERLVEIGDGQVSSAKNWSISGFMGVLAQLQDL